MTVTNTLLRLLVLAAIFVNGWTDAPNAIATAVGSGALTFRRAVGLATLCNFAGAAVSCSFLPTVAATVGELVTFADGQAALNALCAAMLSIILWATAAWRFGLPTSESHALLAGLSGAALALGSADLNGAAWLKTIGGMLISLGAGAAAARLFRLALPKDSSGTVFWQRFSAGSMAFLHGAQDGQKFMALLLMADTLDGNGSSPLLPMLLLTAGCMAFGTALGGRPIVKKVGFELSKLTPTEGLAADLGAGSVLLICSVLGLPVSTTHARVAAVCGAGKDPDLRILSQIGGAWLLTFPCCGLLSFLLTRLMT